MINKRIGCLGIGNMASALINGMLSAGIISASKISVFDPDENKRGVFAEKGCDVCLSNIDAAQKAEILIVAVKPQIISEVLSEISAHLSEGGVLVSIAAGVSIERIQSFVGDYPIVRVMPNACMTCSLGASAISASDNVSSEQLSIVREIFSSCGVAEVIDESLQNSIIAVHGSSPALIFLFAKAVVDEAASEGIDSQIALNLICQTLCGSAKMLLESGKSPDELMKIITSKGGTTEAALSVLDNNNFYDSIRQAMKACRNRAEELGNN